MPHFRKLSAAESAALAQSTAGARAQIAQQYDAYLADVAIGEYGRAELNDDERRGSVRQRLHAAARRCGLALRFRAGPGSLTFCVEAVQVMDVTPTVDASSAAAPHPPPRQLRHPTATERYDAVLPRWMRAGQPPGRRGESKRRHGR